MLKEFFEYCVGKLDGQPKEITPLSQWLVPARSGGFEVVRGHREAQGMNPSRVVTSNASCIMSFKAIELRLGLDPSELLFAHRCKEGVRATRYLDPNEPDMGVINLNLPMHWNIRSYLEPQVLLDQPDIVDLIRNPLNRIENRQANLQLFGSLRSKETLEAAKTGERTLVVKEKSVSAEGGKRVVLPDEISFMALPWASAPETMARALSWSVSVEVTGKDIEFKLYPKAPAASVFEWVTSCLREKVGNRVVNGNLAVCRLNTTDSGFHIPSLENDGVQPEL